METTIRTFQQKTQPTIDAQPKVSVTSLMAAMAAVVVSALGKRCLLVLDAYFAVGPVFAILRQVRDDASGGILELSKPCIDRILYFYPSQKI